VLVLVGTAAHLWADRYFLRFIPLPLSLIETTNNHSFLLPAYQDGHLNGRIELPTHDITTQVGLRKTLDSIRALSPIGEALGFPDYRDITLEKWLRQLKTKTLLCTDATQLFISMAWAQGLKAREWHLLEPHWVPGKGHSVAEFYNPRSEAWQVVDAQQAAIIRDKKTDDILDMTTVVSRFANGNEGSIRIDHGPYADYFAPNGEISRTANYFFKQGLLLTPVLQLRQATWFASYDRKLGLSGHFVIGYPIIVRDWTHDYRVISTKFSLGLFIFAALFIAIMSLCRMRIYLNRF
tara:strand:- start:1873 stop:2754 length:882 start_codon:yes stop_codon:yes gene_type:complete